MEDETIIPIERAAGECGDSFRTWIEERLARLEGARETAVTLEDGSAVAGLLRTFEARIQTMETNVAENTSANLRLADAVASLHNAVKALQPPGQ